MYIRAAQLCFLIEGAASLKEKRQVARSLMEKARHKFNAAIAEVATQDLRQRLTIGVAVVSGDAAQAQTQLNTIIHYMEETAGAELISVDEA